MKTLIDIRGLSKYFRSSMGRKTFAVTDVSFSIGEGETVGLIGQNGAGKTTTIKALMGFIRPSAGTCTVMGIPSDRPDSRKRLGYAPENPAFYDFLTPLQSIQATLVAHRLSPPDSVAHCMKWLARFGIAHAAKRPIRFLSKGMTQRLALAQALAVEPALLVLDEPLSGLDPGGRMEVVEALQEYRGQGGTILFSSHVLFDVERLADRFVMIDRGRLVADMSMRELEKHAHQFRVRTIGDSSAEGLHPDGKDHWIGEIERDRLDGFLGRLLANGHSVVEVRPIMNLEIMYMNLAKSPTTPDARRGH